MKLPGLNVSITLSAKKKEEGLILVDAFIRDELSKGRYDPAISKTCFEMLLELFGRTLKLDLGDHDGKEIQIENVC
jgi:hypothetical protein